MAVEVLTYGSICRAVADTLKPTQSVVRVENYDEISETYPDVPMIQIYPDSGEVDTVGENDRATFNGAIRRTKFTVKVDGIARQRSNLSEDLKAQMDLIDAIDVQLMRQDNKPSFGIQGIQAFHWKWERASMKTGEGQTEIKYAGCQFTVDIWVY